MTSATLRRPGWIITGVVVLCLFIAGAIAVLVNSVTGPDSEDQSSSAIAVPPVMHEGADPNSAATRVDIYVDYRCIWCARFEQTNAATLQAGIADGSLSVTTHPVAILGTFSQEAGNVAGCVAATDLNHFSAWNAAMFAAQGPDTERDLDRDTMIGFARDAGLTDTAELEACVDERRYLPWITGTLDQAREGTLPGLDGVLEGTPTVLINGERYEGSPVDVVAFADALTAAR